jgi:hypothetical protein
MTGRWLFLCLLRNKLPVPGYGTDLRTPHQQPAADRLGNTGAVAVSFYFQRILNPVGRWAYYRRPFHEGGVMDWKLELDALIDPLPAAVAPMTWLTSERDEILQRVSNFRAHQEKMAREREDYYLQAKAKMLAAIDPIPASGQKLC